MKQKTNFLLILSIFFMIGCSDKKKEMNIISIDKQTVIEDFEPSGITLCGNDIYSVSDEGSFLSIKNGVVEYIKIKSEVDYEGITCHNNRLFIAEEGNDNIIEIDFTGKILNNFDIDRKFKGEKVISKKGDGLESLTFYKEDDKSLYFFTSNQSKKFSGNDKSAILVIKVNKLSGKGIIDEYFPLKIKDISGIFYENDIVYFISDKNDKLYIADTQLNVLKDFHLVGDAQEGIFIQDNFLFIADDEGFIIKVELAEKLFDF